MTLTDLEAKKSEKELDETTKRFRDTYQRKWTKKEQKVAKLKFHRELNKISKQNKQ